MADYHTPTVIQQNIPDKDISAFERLLLDDIFSVERHGDELYFFSEDGPSTFLTVERVTLEAALLASRDRPSSIAEEISAQLAKCPIEEPVVKLDLSAVSWEFILQDIVRRSDALSYLTVISSFTCTKMRRDGFGGMAVLITKDAVVGKSTHDILDDLVFEAGLGVASRHAPAAKENCHD
ncbi:hypothetical protein [Methylosinus sp. LW3]|uniref:hypothetical protein n=1 Tax=Methylosinus sp. LW3 TaxID=107635 RepID=UPI0004669151|nr:hypothetical protein [Methylosinus sp. LW3]